MAEKALNLPADLLLTNCTYYPKPPDVSLKGFINYPLRLISRIPEIDPYGNRADVTYVGPLGAPLNVDMPVWPDSAAGDAKIFMYLRASPLLMPMLDALSRMDAAVLCVCPDSEIDCSAFGSNIRVIPQLVSVPEVLKAADAVVSYGATTLVCQVLLAGKPQLVIPTDLEKWLVSQRLENLRVGVAVHKNSGIRPALNRLLSDAMKSAAQAVANRYANVDWRATFNEAMCRFA